MQLDDRLIALDLPIARDQADASLGDENATNEVLDLEGLSVGVLESTGVDKVLLDERADQVEAAQAVAGRSAGASDRRTH